MAVTVTYHVPLPAKIADATYKVEHVWSVQMEYLAISVICRAQQTVKTPYVTYRTEHVLHVTLGGPGCIVKLVRIFIMLILSSVYNNYFLFNVFW